MMRNISARTLYHKEFCFHQQDFHQQGVCCCQVFYIYIQFSHLLICFFCCLNLPFQHSILLLTSSFLFTLTHFCLGDLFGSGSLLLSFTPLLFRIAFRHCIDSSLSVLTLGCVFMIAHCVWHLLSHFT